MHVTEFTIVAYKDREKEKETERLLSRRRDFIKKSLEVHFGFAVKSFVAWWG